MSVEGKPCIRCGSTERNKRGDCRACARARSRYWSASNPDKKKVADNSWYTANKEKCKAASRAWHTANKEKANASRRARYTVNKEMEHARVRRWHKENSVRMVELDRASRRRKKNKSAHAEQRALMMQLGTM